VLIKVEDSTSGEDTDGDGEEVEEEGAGEEGGDGEGVGGRWGNVGCCCYSRRKHTSRRRTGDAGEHLAGALL